MAKVRSPNYPNVSLATALGYVRQIYEQDHRNKVSRAAIGAHLGHESLSGPALGKIGAMRAYGLLEGAGDEMRVSDDAITALMAPEGSADRKAAIERLAFQPPLFREIRNDHPETVPSEQSLQWWLVQHQFTPDAAWIAAKSFQDTMKLVDDVGGSYSASPEVKAPGTGQLKAELHAPSLEIREIKAKKLMEGERELTTGMLSKNAGFRLIVTGEIGVKEIERLIAKLELDKEILAEPDGGGDDE